MKERRQEVTKCKSQLEMCGRQGKVLVCPVYEDRGELSHSVRDQAKKGKTEPWTWNYARDFIYGGSGHRYKLIQPEVAPHLPDEELRLRIKPLPKAHVRIPRSTI